MNKEAPIKVLLAKPGLDGHDRGVKVIALALRDAGMEVIYTGLHQTVEQIVRVAIQESAEVIGLSMLSGSHIPISQRLMKRLQEEELADDVLVVVGGNIPNKHFETLKSLGVDCIFPTDTAFEDIVEGIRAKARKK
jgi:methylmalonyl-CoA mutase C-terminal domain/subunit